MKATLQGGSIVEVLDGLDWSIRFDIIVLNPDGFAPRDSKAVRFDSLMTQAVYLGCITKCSCKFGPHSLARINSASDYWFYRIE